MNNTFVSVKKFKVSISSIVNLYYNNSSLRTFRRTVNPIRFSSGRVSVYIYIYII
jgi:hypothetical protein